VVQSASVVCLAILNGFLMNECVQCKTLKEPARYHPRSSRSPLARCERMVGVEELLRCPCCLELFTDPHQLPCGHRFCLDCLDGVQCLTCSAPYYRQDVSAIARITLQPCA